MSEISFHNLSRVFGRQTILSNVTLDVASGQRIVLLGANGAGKTTLLRLAAGLLRPSQGSVTRGGHDLTDPAARNGLEFVGQDAPIYRELSVREHLQWWADCHGTKVDVAGWLADAGLSKMASELTGALSRGQRQRLRLAMALSLDRDLLLLDEPNTGLDADGQEWLLAHLNKSRAAMIISSHDAGFAAALGATTHTLEGGRLA